MGLLADAFRNLRRNVRGLQRSRGAWTHLLFEGLLVGVLFLFVACSVHVVASLSLGTHVALQRNALCLQAISAGLIGHVMFELFGLNAEYCKQRKPPS